jgi:hypothetical protein
MTVGVAIARDVEANLGHTKRGEGAEQGGGVWIHGLEALNNEGEARTDIGAKRRRLEEKVSTPWQSLAHLYRLRHVC